MAQTLLFDFAFHDRTWLSQISEAIKGEPWGKPDRFHVLQTYLKANFEIAKHQNLIYEDNRQAIWKPGYLLSKTNEPIYLIYKLNTRKGQQKWVFDKVVDRLPINKDLQVVYDIPKFDANLKVKITPFALKHIEEHNYDRLKTVFKDLTDNKHLVLNAIYGQINLKKQEYDAAIPEWYAGKFQWLLPLNLTDASKVQLTATLEPKSDAAEPYYNVRTVLFPNYAYPYARAVAKSYNSLSYDWIRLTEQEINESSEDTE